MSSVTSEPELATNYNSQPTVKTWMTSTTTPSHHRLSQVHSHLITDHTNHTLTVYSLFWLTEKYMLCVFIAVDTKPLFIDCLSGFDLVSGFHIFLFHIVHCLTLACILTCLWITSLFCLLFLLKHWTLALASILVTWHLPLVTFLLVYLPLAGTIANIILIQKYMGEY